MATLYSGIIIQKYVGILLFGYHRICVSKILKKGYSIVNVLICFQNTELGDCGNDLVCQMCSFEFGIVSLQREGYCRLITSLFYCCVQVNLLRLEKLVDIIDHVIGGYVIVQIVHFAMINVRNL